MSLALFAAGEVRAAPALRVDVPQAGCPRRKDVVTALEARLPGVTRSGSGAGSIRRLSVDATETPGVVQLRLWDDRDVLALERRLGNDAAAGAPSAGTGRAAPRADENCQALAQAVALVVDRYLREIGYRPAPASVPAPPAPPAPENETAPTPSPPEPPVATVAAPAPANTATAASTPAATATPTATSAAGPTASRPPTAGVGVAAGPGQRAPGRSASLPSAAYVGLGGGARLGPSGRAADPDAVAGRSEVFVRAGGHRGHLAAELGLGISSLTVVPVAAAPGAELRLRSYPVRLGLGAWWPAPGGAVVVTAGASADLLSFAAVGLADARSGLRLDPAAELAVGYSLAVGRWQVRATLGGGLTLAPRDFDIGRADPVYRTPAGYVRSAVEVGWALWKNYEP